MITGIIITKNEEANIGDAVSNLSFCDEVIVCDNISMDKTVRIAKKNGAKVYSKKFNSYSVQRNYALKKANNNWVLYLDADEKINPKLRSEIFEIVKKNTVCGARFERIDKFLGRNIYHGENGNIRLLRLAKKEAGFWKRSVHEYWDVKGEIYNAKNSLIHNSPRNLSSYYEKLNKFSLMHKNENKKEGKSANFVKVVLFPFLKFIDNFVFKAGFFDGVHGFVIAVSMSFHSFLSWSQMYLEKQK